MKKFIIAATVMLSSAAFAQCNINGKSTIKVNETETYVLENDDAQCTDCHLWVAIGGNSELEGDTKKGSVKLKSTSGGRTVISLSVLTPKGLSQCSKNIDIITDNTTILNTQKNIDCDININGFKEVKYSEGIVTFFPSSTQNEYKYNWTAIYKNGEQKTSLEKIPQFNYSKQNGIITMKVRIVSSKCMKDMSKTYDDTYWKFF